MTKYYLKVYDLDENGNPDYSRPKALVVNQNVYSKLTNLIKNQRNRCAEGYEYERMEPIYVKTFGDKNA